MKKPYEFKVLGGCKFPLQLSSECVEEALNFTPRDGDIGVVTYPRSGTTWTQQIVLRLLKYDEFIGSWSQLYSKSPCLELQGTKKIDASAGPVFYKTHIPFHHSRFNPRSKYIWVVRNPRDVCVSSYHLYSDLHPAFWSKRYPLKQYVKHFCEGDVYYGGYWDHLRSWWKVKDEPNVLMLVYEQMKKDPRASIIRIGEFLGGRCAELVKDDKVVDQLLTATSVKATRKQANVGFLRNLTRFNKLEISVAQGFFLKIWRVIGNDVSFVRKGVVNDWKNHFDPEVEEIFNAWIQKQPDHLEIMKLFE